MSSTNKTQHYNLPQFIGSDIPTWLGDFNSAMTAIDSGINAAATSASGAATTASQAATSASEAATNAAQALQAANRCPFPIGFGGFFQTDPNSIYAGTTWEQKKDVFILAAGETYPAGRTGGEAVHTLTTQELPSGIIGVNSTNENFLQEVNGIAQGSGFGWVGRNHTSTPTPVTNMPPYFAMPFWIRTA